MKIRLTCVAACVAGGSAWAEPRLQILITPNSDQSYTIRAELSNYESSFPTENFSALNAFDFYIDGLASFDTPRFPDLHYPGLIPDLDPLAFPFGRVELDRDFVAWFIQYPHALLAPATPQAWLGDSFEVGTFTTDDGSFSLDDFRIQNLAAAYEDPDAITLARTPFYINNFQPGDDAPGTIVVVSLVPAPASASLIALAGLASTRRR